MPTRTATLGRERSVATLARRLFVIEEGAGKVESQRRAEAALLAANPSLARASGFRSGKPIVVPAVRGLRPTENVTRISTKPAGVTDEVRTKLQLGSSLAEEKFRTGEESLKSRIGQLDQREFRTAVGKVSPEAVPLMKAAQDRLQERQSKAAEVSAQLTKAFEEATASINALQKLAQKAARNLDTD